MMELDYSKIHHSRKICGTEQAEFIEDKRLRDTHYGPVQKRKRKLGSTSTLQIW